MNPTMNPMAQRLTGSLGFPRMRGAQSPPIMAPAPSSSARREPGSSSALSRLR
jgi:hypothetical protein